MDTWAQFRTWYLVLPPSRPSAAQLALIAEYAAPVSRTSPVAVLGSTPEFRDLLCELDFTDVSVLDRNSAFHKAMSHSRIYDNAELFVHGDWLETLPLLGPRFSLILSDLTSGNLSYERRPAFYAAVEDALAPGGLFIDKVLTHPIPHAPLAVLLRKYMNLPLNLLHVNHFSCEVLFCSDLLDIRQEVDTTLFYDTVLASTSDARIRAFVREAYGITPRDCVWSYGRAWDELAGSYCPRLTRLLERVEDSRDDPYAHRLRYFVLRKEGPAPGAR